MMPTLEEVGCFWNHLLLWKVRHTYLSVKSGGSGSGWSVQELRCAFLPTQPLGLKALCAVSHGALHESILNPGTDHDPGRQQVVTAFPGIREQGLYSQLSSASLILSFQNLSPHPSLPAHPLPVSPISPFFLSCYLSLRQNLSSLFNYLMVLDAGTQ